MNLVQWLKNNDMLLPNYKEVSIIDLIRTLYKYCGYPYKTEKINKDIDKYIENKKHILFILIDGMGSNLINSLSDKSILKQNKVADLLTVFPTTTGCVLSSISAAEYPITHGILGWYNYNRDKDINYYALLFKDRKSEMDLTELGVNEEDIYVSSSIMNKLNRKTTAIFPEKIVDSKFSKFILNKNRISYQSLKEAFEKTTINIQNNKAISTFTYLYLPYIDSISHDNGVYSNEVKRLIFDIEKELVNLKNKNIENLEIIITADHRQIDVTQKDITMDFEKYCKYFYALPTIDYGTAMYYVKEDKKKEFLIEFEKDYKNEMYIFKTEEFIENHMFGNDKMSEYMKNNIGEFISLCKKGAYFVNEINEPEKYIGKVKGSHSGLSKEELTVPLIVIK